MKMYSGEEVVSIQAQSYQKGYHDGYNSHRDESQPDPAIIDLELRAEAEKEFPYTLNDRGKYIDNEYNHIQSARRSAYIQGRTKSIAIQKEMGELLMTKDGEIESLLNDVAELENKLKKTEQIAEIATEGLRDASKEIDRLKQDVLEWKRVANKHNL